MNANFDPALCRDHLGRLMLEESSLLGQLEAQLLREYQLLTDNDVDGRLLIGSFFKRKCEF